MVDDDRAQCPNAQFTSINAALSAASPGDTIQVAAGIYQEHVIVGKSVTILGAQAGVVGVFHKGGESTVDAMLMRRFPSCTLRKATCAPFGISGICAANTSGFPRRASDQHGQT